MYYFIILSLPQSKKIALISESDIILFKNFPHYQVWLLGASEKGETRPQPWATEQHSLCPAPVASSPSQGGQFPATLQMGNQAAWRLTHAPVHSGGSLTTAAAGSLYPFDGLQVSLWADRRSQGVSIHLCQRAEQGHEVGHGAKRSPCSISG